MAVCKALYTGSIPVAASEQDPLVGPKWVAARSAGHGLQPHASPIGGAGIASQVRCSVSRRSAARSSASARAFRSRRFRSCSSSESLRAASQSKASRLTPARRGWTAAEPGEHRLDGGLVRPSNRWASGVMARDSTKTSSIAPGAGGRWLLKTIDGSTVGIGRACARTGRERRRAPTVVDARPPDLAGT
jgi:hypothetical protein